MIQSGGSCFGAVSELPAPLMEHMLAHLAERWSETYRIPVIYNDPPYQVRPIDEVLEITVELADEAGVHSRTDRYRFENQDDVELVLLAAMGLLWSFDKNLKSPFKGTSLNPGIISPNGELLAGTQAHVRVKPGTDERKMAKLFLEYGADKLLPEHREDPHYLPALHIVFELARRGGILRVRCVR